MATNSGVKVIKLLNFANQQAAQKYLRDMNAQYRKADPDTGKPLYKTPAGIVLRATNATQMEVLANCVC